MMTPTQILWACIFALCVMRVLGLAASALGRMVT
jgi:hypothetical protein